MALAQSTLAFSTADLLADFAVRNTFIAVPKTPSLRRVSSDAAIKYSDYTDYEKSSQSNLAGAETASQLTDDDHLSSIETSSTCTDDDFDLRQEEMATMHVQPDAMAPMYEQPAGVVMPMMYLMTAPCTECLVQNHDGDIPNPWGVPEAACPPVMYAKPDVLKDWCAMQTMSNSGRKVRGKGKTKGKGKL